MKIIIAGGRDFNDYHMLKSYVCSLIKDNNIEDVEIVCGMAKGADLLGERFAREFHYNIRYFPAEWNEYGKSAGCIRNNHMAAYANLLIAFWDGTSKGTKHMINSAKKHGLRVHVVKY